MEWNEDAITRLRALWAEGHSTAEIGRRMNVSKNAVVGKAHRLELMARPSPIHHERVAGWSARPASPRRAVGPTLPPLPGAHAAQPPQKPPLPAAAERPSRLPGVSAAPAAAPVRAVPARALRLSACCWPIGEPGTASFHFCDADALAGKPYCAEHAQIAYVKVRDRRDEAA